MSKTETSAAIEKLQKEIQVVSDGRVETAAKTEEVAPVKSSNEPGSPQGNSVEIAALVSANEDIKKKLEETNNTVAKLKESVQTALKKVKEEFTALKTSKENLPNEATSLVG